MVQESKFTKVSGIAKSNGIELYYESFGEATNPAIVLIMGLDAQCILWSIPFIEPLVAAGFRVIRFDNRDIGHSTWLQNWRKSMPYTLEDMAKDTVGLLDYLHIKQAHFIGASMGGMITQRLAISHANRVKSITCIMSTAFPLDPDAFNSLYKKTLVKLAPRLLKWITLKNKFTNNKVSINRYMATYKYLAGTKYPFDKEYFREMFTYCIDVRKGQNPAARYRQFCAIVASGSRLSELNQIKAKTLIIHGTADKLVPIMHSRKYAKLINKATIIELEGIGHEIPKAAVAEYHEAILKHLLSK